MTEMIDKPKTTSEEIEKLIREEHADFFSAMAEKRRLAKSDLGRKMIDELEKRFIDATKDELLHFIKETIA